MIDAFIIAIHQPATLWITVGGVIFICIAAALGSYEE